MIKYKTQKSHIDSCVCEIGSIFHGRFVYSVGTYRHATFARATISQYTYDDIDKDMTDQRMENNNKKTQIKKKKKKEMEKECYNEHSFIVLMKTIDLRVNQVFSFFYIIEL